MPLFSFIGRRIDTANTAGTPVFIGLSDWHFSWHLMFAFGAFRAVEASGVK